MLRGALRYPSETDGWQLGVAGLGERMENYHDREVALIITSVGKAGKEQMWRLWVGPGWSQ